MTRQSGFKQSVRARMSETGESYTAARAHLHRGRPSLVNVTNGESTSMSLRTSGVPGEVLTYPARLPEADRYVLWFEADLYDQLLLIEVLSTHEVEPARMSLVSIGEYRGKAHFGGLGELTPEQLADLLPEAVPLTSEAVELARQAWRAYQDPRPLGLPAIARAVSPELRFLGEAFARLMQEYPWRGDGLSLSERRILQAMDEGAPGPREAFLALWRRERRPFLADQPTFELIKGLTEAGHPLLAPGPDRDGLRLTPIGREVLGGSADHVRLNGIDRWIGGVHLTGEADWRYDERLETVVKT
ncbi:MAG TPA: hypothetical protein VF160_05900 [Candidatus Dormibacteraeota bacterium]